MTASIAVCSWKSSLACAQWLGPIPVGRREGSSATDRGAGRDRASILLPWSCSPYYKQTTSFSAPLYFRHWFLSILCFSLLLSLLNLSRYDEPTPPGVTMTESHTRCVTRRKSRNSQRKRP